MVGMMDSKDSGDAYHTGNSSRRFESSGEQKSSELENSIDKNSSLQNAGLRDTNPQIISLHLQNKN